MSKKLVIIESPGKLKSYRKYLSADFTIIASVGHVFDLPKKETGVDIKNDFAVDFEVMTDKKEVFQGILAAAKKVDEVYIMTDPDREGAGIGYNIYSNLPKGTKVKRAKTQSITKQAIQDAIANAYDVSEDQSLVDSFLARRIVDRLCGYKTSFLVKRATGGASAGRTQSAALRILSEREKEIAAFVPEEYWPIAAELLTKEHQKVLASIKVPDERDIKNGDQAKEICDVLRKGPAVVCKYEKKENATRALAPFTTAAMCQAAAAIFGWKVDKTGKIAQSLYEAGVITYHRTDSTFLVPEFISTVRSHVGSEYGDKYVPSSPNYFSSKKNAQEAHEACRVVDIGMKAYTSGSPEDARLYQMIWKRSVASQMSETRKLGISAEFKVGKYTLSASGSKLLFDGWRKVWDYGDVKDTTLPEMKIGDVLQVIDVQTEQKFTQPPPRYNAGSFNKKLETEGIGRPATYAAIPKTLEARGYIEGDKNIIVTKLGLKVNDFLAQFDFCFADVGFTADLEMKLDDICTKKTDKLTVLNAFWDRLKADIKKSGEFKKEKNLSIYDCPICKDKGIESKLCLRESKWGKFYSCERYGGKNKKDNCTYKADVGENNEPIEKVIKEVKVSEIKCPDCGKNLVVRASKKTGKEFLGCPGWKPKGGCQVGIFDLDGNKIEFKPRKSWNKRKFKKESEDD